MNPLISIADIKKHEPCQPVWDKVVGLYGGEPPDDLMVSLGDVAQHLGADNAYWCIRALDWSDIAVWRAVIAGALLPTIKRVAVHTTDNRVHGCIDAIERWHDGDDSVDLSAAARDAWAAARAAAWAARAAAWAAAWAAWAARAARADARADAERERQRQDIITAFPPVYLGKGDGQ